MRLQLKPPRGLTLIEMMVGLTITAILAGVAAPFFGDYINNSRLRENGNSLMAEALYAQSEALKRNGQVQLSVAAGSVQIIDVSGAAPVTLRTRSFTQGISASVAGINFGSDGMTRPIGTEVSIDMASSGVTCSAQQRCPRLIIEAGGAIRLCGNKLSCP